jgi:hypothetical protein
MSAADSPGDTPAEAVALATPATAMTFAEFLESVPPAQEMRVRHLWKWQSSGGARYRELSTPELQLHCSSSTCNGPRFFRYKEGNLSLGENEPLLTFLTYVCSNCQREEKTFSLLAEIETETTESKSETDKKPRIMRISRPGFVYKFGELPVYGPPTPARLIRLFEDERETFLKGRRCENQGLGIGAFVYYRRVVETQKNRILDEIIRVSEKVGAPAQMIKALATAKTVSQFSKALASIKDAIPQALLLNGHNPLTMLHKALSTGLHEKTDEECLEIAHDVRVVLIELADRLGQLLKDEAELNSAVTRLLAAKQDK